MADVAERESSGEAALRADMLTALDGVRRLLIAAEIVITPVPDDLLRAAVGLPAGRRPAHCRCRHSRGVAFDRSRGGDRRRSLQA
jgi:hypothetical protein